MEKCKTKGKSLLSSFCGIAICLSLIAGATFALFTSESKTDISVTSGKVAVVTTLNTASLTLESMGKDTTATGAFENGGTVALNSPAGGDVQIAAMTPGDRAAFVLNTTNNSTVRVAYRLAFTGGETTESSGGGASSKHLLDYLIVTIDGKPTAAGTDTAWQTVEIGGAIGDITIGIEMPQSTPNEAQGLSQTLHVTLTAVQANGVASMPGSITQEATKNTDGSYEAKTPIADIAFDAAATTAIESAFGGKPVEQLVMSVGLAENSLDETTGITTKTFELNLTAQFTDGTTDTIGDFGTGKASVTVFVGKGIIDQAILINYVAADGTKTPVTDGVYDATEGTYTFSTNHFSTYELQLVPVTNGLTYQLSADGESYAVYGKTLTVDTVVIPGSYNGLPVSIGAQGFYKNTSIKKVVMLAGVKGFDFYFKKSDIDKTNPISSAFEECTALESVILPEGIETLYQWAFYNCKNLNYVSLPASLTELGVSVFRNCTSLQSITLPSNLKAIGNGVFQDCSSLTGIILPEGLEKISDHMFNGCINLEGIIIPKSVTAFGKSAFMLNEKMTNFVIPEGITSIGDYCFYECKNLQTVSIPASVTSIGSNQVFGLCSSLESITVDAKNANYMSQDGVLYDITMKKQVHVSAMLTGEITIPASVTNVDVASLKAIEKLTGISVEPENTKYLGQDGILYDKSTKEIVVIPKDLTGEVVILEGVPLLGTTQTGDNTASFFNRANLTSIVVPTSVTTIMGYAFQNCTSLTSFTFAAGSQLNGLGNYAFDGCASLTAFNLPKSVTSISNGNPFSNCANMTSLTVESGSTNFYAEGNCIVKIYPDNPAIKSVSAGCGASVIPKNVTSIWRNAFESSIGLTEVIIPDNVTEIASSAFWGCTDLTKITISKKATTISSSAFGNCTNLTAITYKGTVAEWKKVAGTNHFGAENCIVTCTDGVVQ